MTGELATLERTHDGGLIRFERTLSHSIDQVWSALTETDRLADWWPPFATDVRVDLREGGTMSFDWPDGPRLSPVSPHRAADAAGAHPHQPRIVDAIRLEPAVEGTLLRATYFVPIPTQPLPVATSSGVTMASIVLTLRWRGSPYRSSPTCSPICRVGTPNWGWPMPPSEGQERTTPWRCRWR